MRSQINKMNNLILEIIFDVYYRMKNRRIRKIITSAGRNKALYPSPSQYRIPVALPGRVTTIELRNFSIPNSIYNVDSRNDQIIIDGVGALIKHGNYTPSALAAEVTAVVGLVGFVASYSAITAKMTLTHSAPFAFGGSIIGTLGFSAGGSGAAMYEADGVVDLSYTSVLYLRLNNLSASGALNGELGAIYNEVGFGEMITSHSGYAPIDWVGDAPAFSELEISFVDAGGRLIDFNGANHTLEFEIFVDIE